ncbi:MAG: mevalonate kinase [Kouleothrix sp.]|nr:mevalonate kinase [Kouleothrix sp.]
MPDQRPVTDEQRPAADSLDEPDASAPPVDRRSSASAPAKLILCGEHAVVYGRPAIALPLAGIRARATVGGARPGSGISILARDLRRRWRLSDEPANPLSELIARVLAYLAARPPAQPHAGVPDLRISIQSTIPIASGMGSGAAVATALVRALAAYLGHDLPPAEISALVYASEQRFHGTPSGIDNTVIAYELPIWFKRSNVQTFERSNAPLIEPIGIAAPFTLLIGDTGVRSATRAPVGEVRRRWQAEPDSYEALFDQVGALVAQARRALAQGDLAGLGPILSENHELLRQIGVSSPELDGLVGAAQAAGALGAKLSGAGWGGVMLALVAPERCEPVARALGAAGAKRVIETTVSATGER